ncbi:MAG: hypothetical protein R2724_28110 [Bryobacterales bacterium]
MGPTARQRARFSESSSGGGGGGFIPATHFTTFIILALNFMVFMAMMILSSKLGSRISSASMGVWRTWPGAKNRLAILGYGQWCA